MRVKIYFQAREKEREVALRRSKLTLLREELKRGRKRRLYEKKSKIGLPCRVR